VKTIVYAIRWMLHMAMNLVRRLWSAPDYVTFTLERPMSELAPPRGSRLQRLLSKKPTTLRDLQRQLRHVAADRRVRGVVLRLYAVGGPLAQLQSLRDLIQETRNAGKRVVIWSHAYDMAAYYVATAADDVLLQYGGTVSAFGMESSYLFLADALERVGLKGDFVQITPYKTAPDMLTRTSMSDEAREMATWLIDDLYEQHVEGIAAGRSMSADEAKALLDGCPYIGERAVDVGAVDAVLSQEALPTYLGLNDRPAKLAPYKRAKRRVLRPAPVWPGRAVAVLRLAGDIIDGRSAVPPARPPFRVPLLMSEKAGDLTVADQARALARNRRVAAVVLHVDSGGGSATASESMAAALKTVADKKPLVVSMGTVAASGGYYVATPGASIVAQPGTITGSIGVLTGKIITSGMFEKLRVHRETLVRGEHAGYYSSTRPFTDEERTSLRETIVTIYEQFLERVAVSREMSRDEVDAVGGGRVWTGRQALERGLVDELGGLELALQRAKEAAGLSRRAPVIEMRVPKRGLAPRGAASEVLDYAFQGIRLFEPGRALMLSSMVVWDGP